MLAGIKRYAAWGIHTAFFWDKYATGVVRGGTAEAIFKDGYFHLCSFLPVMIGTYQSNF